MPRSTSASVPRAAVASSPALPNAPAAARSSRSSTMTRLRRSRSAASSILPGSSAPSVVRCVLVATSSAWSSGMRDQVARMMTSHRAARAGASSTTTSARSEARLGVRSVARVWSNERSVRRPAATARAWAPTPTKPSVRAAGSARTWVASAALSPVRQAVMVAESASASSSPVVRSWRQTTPRRAGEDVGNFALTLTV
jgi:hypothetical protein